MLQWPDNKDFAFTIFDDTDLASLENVPPVYSFLDDLGVRITKSVWPLKGSGVPRVGGLTCDDARYLDWTLALQDLGYEIGFHNASYATSSRDETLRGLELFREIYGYYPRSMSNHTGCLESIYWGDARLSGANRLVYQLLTRFKRRAAFKGHVEGDPLFWGDACRERVKFVRNFVYADLNTLKACPMMPYHDPDRPYVNYWFASTEAPTIDSFINSMAAAEQDRLEEEHGACILYTHLACGFFSEGKLHPRFKELMTRLTRKRGWFVPVSTLLEYIQAQTGHREITRSERTSLERRWLRHKIRVRSS
jgi:hypothetical protein